MGEPKPLTPKGSLFSIGPHQQVAEEIYLGIALDYCFGLTPNSYMNINLTQSRGPTNVKNTKGNRTS